jgi:hypothetical protein
MNRAIRTAVILLIGATTLAGCSKVKDSVDPAIFGGTWNGTVTCVGMDPMPASITINMSGSTATTDGSTGGGACAMVTTYTGKLYNDHLVFSPQVTTDACGNSNTFSASVYVSDNRMSLTQSLSGPTLTTNCSFVGSK